MDVDHILIRFESALHSVDELHGARGVLAILPRRDVVADRPLARPDHRRDGAGGHALAGPHGDTGPNLVRQKISRRKLM